MSSTVVHVKNISHQTSEKEVRDFFSFCGKITSLSVTPASEAADSPQSATVTFEKETAAKTALLLDNTQLGHSQVQVSSAAGIDELAKSGAGADQSAHDEHEISQEDKPRSRIVAEYLAHGYVISDGAIQRAIALDNQHGVSTRFTNALTNFDSKYKATERAKGIDASYGITEKANAGWRGLSSYFEKALGTPTGQKLATFYTQSDKQVRDIHAEARRLADLKSGKTSGSSAEHDDSPKGESSEKSEKSEFKGEKSATGPADEVAASSGVAPLGENNQYGLWKQRVEFRHLLDHVQLTTNADSTNDENSFTERLRRKIWGIPDPSAEPSPPAQEDPYGDQSVRARDDKRSETFTELQDPSAPIDMGDYVPASTWDGLESTGGPHGWWEDDWDRSNPFEGFMAPSKMESREDISKAIHRALVEVFTLKEAGQPLKIPMDLEETLQADFYRAVAFKQDADGNTVPVFIHKQLREDILDSLTYETEYKFSNELDDEDQDNVAVTEEGSAEILLENRPTDENWLNVHFNDDAVKFAVLKRVMQLTGVRIPDPAIQDIKSAKALFGYLVKKPKPKKLAETLLGSEALTSLPNVKILARRYTPIDKEKQIGRWKVIEKELIKQGLPVTGGHPRAWNPRGSS